MCVKMEVELNLHIMSCYMVYWVLNGKHEVGGGVGWKAIIYQILDPKSAGEFYSQISRVHK